MEVPDQGHSLFLLNDPSKRAFVKVDGKPVPVLLTRQEGQRRVTGSIKGVPGQTFEVAFWDGTKKSMHGRKVSLFFGKQWVAGSHCSVNDLRSKGADDDKKRFKVWKGKGGRPFQFAKLPTTDDAAAGCSDMSKINEVHCIKIVYEGIKGIKPRKKDEKAQQSSTGQHDPVRKQESAWKKLGAVNERSDKGQFGLTPSFGARPDDRLSTPSAQVESNEPEYKDTYNYVDGTDIEFVFYIRSSTWIDMQINAEPQTPAVMPKGAVAANGAIYLDHEDDEIDADIQLAKNNPSKRIKTSHEGGVLRIPPPAAGDRFERDSTSFSETDDDSADDDLSPQELARTLHQNPQLYALIKAAAKGETVNLPSPTPELAVSPFAAQSTSDVGLTQNGSAHSAQGAPETAEDGPVAGGSGVGAAGAAQVGEVWRGVV